MTSKERIIAILNHQKTDRIGICEHFWAETMALWQEQGHVEKDLDMCYHFDFDIARKWVFNLIADLNFEPQIIAETENTITMLDGNGATLKRHKHHDTTPEHIDFSIKTKEDWEGKIKPFLTADDRRIDFVGYRNAKAQAKKENKFFAVCQVNVFELMSYICGHEYMLMGMALDPEWIKDMAMTYAKLSVELQKMLFDKEGYPDGVWYYEDLGYKGTPFMSTQMYKELIKPAHVYTIGYAKDNNLSVILHSCGFIEPLLPDIIETGIDCLQAMEVKAGMDLLRIQKNYGDKIALMGGIDVRCLLENSKDEIEKELSDKIPIVKNGFNYILHTDHSIPKIVEYKTYKFFIKKGLELGTFED